MSIYAQFCILNVWLSFWDMAVPLMCRLCDLDIWPIKVKLCWWTDYDPICVKDLDLHRCSEWPDFQFGSQIEIFANIDLGIV